MHWKICKRNIERGTLTLIERLSKDRLLRKLMISEHYLQWNDMIRCCTWAKSWIKLIHHHIRPIEEQEEGIRTKMRILGSRTFMPPFTLVDDELLPVDSENTPSQRNKGKLWDLDWTNPRSTLSMLWYHEKIKFESFNSKLVHSKVFVQGNLTWILR